MTDETELMALNELTGLVHEYAGAGLGYPLDCGCELDEDELDHLTAIRREHVERGVWETAPCVEDDTNPDTGRQGLEDVLDEKMDHSCYDDASYRWIKPDVLYIHLPRGGLCQTSVSSKEIPDPWYIANIWCKTEETIVAVTRGEWAC